jgi:methylenetetrahydrofolate dehydrogenase (NADP+)/methenyltetrahydrofolate cyclohydrolase
MISSEITARNKKSNESQRRKVPHLAAIIVGNDGASLTYVGSKILSIGWF